MPSFACSAELSSSAESGYSSALLTRARLLSYDSAQLKLDAKLVCNFAFSREVFYTKVKGYIFRELNVNFIDADSDQRS
jgi:hypothetical protein